MIDAIEIANPSAFSISSLGPKGPWDEILKALGLAISIASINRFGKCYIVIENILSSTCVMYAMYGVRNLEMSIRFSLKSRLSERFHRPEMSQIKAEISLRTNVKLIFHKNVGLQ